MVRVVAAGLSDLAMRARVEVTDHQSLSSVHVTDHQLLSAVLCLRVVRALAGRESAWAVV